MQRFALRIALLRAPHTAAVPELFWPSSMNIERESFASAEVSLLAQFRLPAIGERKAKAKRNAFHDDSAKSRLRGSAMGAAFGGGPPRFLPDRDRVRSRLVEGGPPKFGLGHPEEVTL